MYALVDAVSFYASAEKVFDPAIRFKPVVVLTNNDGCICAVCPIAKKLSIPKFQPYFKVKPFLDAHKVVVRSSNYELYADLSERMMTVINRYCDNHYVYSIDESFLQFTGFQNIISDWFTYGKTIRRAVWRETGLPVGVGFGPTPTLAKAANHAAKKLAGFRGVAVINDEQSRKNILSQMSVTDVWGIGSRLGKKLTFLGIHSALDLANQNPKMMRRQFSVVVERTINELNGITCLSWDDVKQNKKEIFSTRSFGERIFDAHTLNAALVTHGSIVAKKLRNQHSLTKKLLIFASSSVHEDNYYKKSILYDFAVPTCDTIVIANAIAEVLPQIFKANTRFYRCGVGAIELADSKFQQKDLFATTTDQPELMKCLDSINKRYGTGTLSLACEKKTQHWQMKRALLSPQYTTRWSDIPVVDCN
ncbi:Y-family DNA polymerase [Pseudoalteromonas tunicata]|jgi:DNA polymerase V|uniref:Component of DNA polymerase V with UmuD n=1 Tax=Pseudoalteromonas tunicata D2 TaxID=87626 RepID=A4CBH8_9GAMM|nr:Y-family DNA polymerase [Pseudoalteromonas tunicata]ATC94272.1 DNA polymerase V [Pseudoalteromonas tunicata]AXT30018.1 Y-family DNA polymerase [Pseudoalteromonas tunicata]EAR27715.1 component of DNA polymerase V with UmuD [Pseudoalteromonas tunicata D2]